MSYVEDMGVDAYDVPEHFYNELHWKSGFHYDANDKAHLIREMETSHLENTIKYFSELDTTPLKKELKRRNHNNV
jgi:hypothetical protein